MIRLILITALLLFQAGGQQEEPDPHEGQPGTCNNSEGNPHPCACNHAMQCPSKERENEDSKCQVYCRHDACRCCKECPTTRDRISATVFPASAALTLPGGPPGR